MRSSSTRSTRLEPSRARRECPSPPSAGEVFRGGGLVEGGSRQDVRGILETRAEVLALREQCQALRAAVAQLAAEEAALDGLIPHAQAALGALRSQQHDYEKDIVGLESASQRAADDLARVSRRQDLVETERRRAEDEERAAERRREESVAAIAAHALQQRDAEDRLGGVAGRLQSARVDAEASMRLVSESRTEQATLTERLAGLETEVARLEDAASDIEARIRSGGRISSARRLRRAELRQSILDTGRLIDEDVRVD